MPILDRTPLTASDKTNLLLKTAACQDHGVITLLSKEFSISRKAVYSARNTMNSALSSLIEDPEVPQCITSVHIDEPQLQRAIVALTITAPNSIRSIETLIPTLFPSCKVSYGYIQNIIVQAQQNAAEFNKSVSLVKIKSCALDEMFSQGDPVLAGVCLDSGYLHSLSHQQQRDGGTWEKVLDEAKHQGMQPSHVVKDGATGMAKGVKSVFPNAEQRDDAFHALYIARKEVGKLENRAYRHIEKEEGCEKTLRKANDDNRRSLAMKLSWASSKCTDAIDDYEHSEKALKTLHSALGCICPESGLLMNSDQAKQLLSQAAQWFREIERYNFKKVAKYIENRLEGLTFATEALYQKLMLLSGEYSEHQVVLGCKFIEKKQQLVKTYKQERQILMNSMFKDYGRLRAFMSKSDIVALVVKIELLMRSRHRASSAVEGFNATLRTYLYVRKGVNQGFLDLFQAWYNLRERRWGRNKGTSAYDMLTGGKTKDWLTLLGFPPSEINH